MEEDAVDKLEEEEVEQEEQELPLAAGITINILADGAVKIDFRWDSEDEENAVYLGKLLYTLTKGHLNELISDILSKEVLKDISCEKFVSRALKIWESELLKEELERKLPFVPSLRVWNVSRN